MDRLSRTVREQVALGRLLPLGAPEDGAWITERTAVAALRAVCAALPGVRLGRVNILPVPDGPVGPEVSPAAPVGAVPHRPLRIEARFEAALGEPLPVLAERLRTALFAAAGDSGLGLPVQVVDLAVTGLVDDATALAGAPAPPARPELADDYGPTSASDAPARPGTAAAVQAAVLSVPGVARVTRRLAGHAGVHVHDSDAAQGSARYVRLQLAAAPSYRPLTVARAASAAATQAATPGAPGSVSTAVLITDLA
ncbi:hypothetical protein [Streptomyces sp. CA2R106]|uniref:hypothetical protein n=1 Tax=Streptomyces sp. CA2R106 TaxID=3120153 RepID=UPI00300AF2BF